MTRRASLSASVVLAVAISACGSGSSSRALVAEPTDATLTAFCQTFGRLSHGATARQAAEFEGYLKRLSRADHRDVNAFFDYVRTQCNGPAA